MRAGFFRVGGLGHTEGFLLEPGWQTARPQNWSLVRWGGWVEGGVAEELVEMVWAVRTVGGSTIEGRSEVVGGSHSR